MTDDRTDWEEAQRPTIKVVKPRYQGSETTLIVYIEGERPEQRIRVYLSGSNDILRVFVRHGIDVEMEVSAEAEVPWHQ